MEAVEDQPADTARYTSGVWCDAGAPLLQCGRGIEGKAIEMVFLCRTSPCFQHQRVVRNATDGPRSSVVNEPVAFEGLKFGASVAITYKGEKLVDHLVHKGFGEVPHACWPQWCGEANRRKALIFIPQYWVCVPSTEEAQTGVSVAAE